MNSSACPTMSARCARQGRHDCRFRCGGAVWGPVGRRCGCRDRNSPDAPGQRSWASPGRPTMSGFADHGAVPVNYGDDLPPKKSSRASMRPEAAVVAELADLVARGELEVPIAGVFALDPMSLTATGLDQSSSPVTAQRRNCALRRTVSTRMLTGLCVQDAYRELEKRHTRSIRCAVLGAHTFARSTCRRTAATPPKAPAATARRNR